MNLYMKGIEAIYLLECVYVQDYFMVTQCGILVYI